MKLGSRVQKIFAERRLSEFLEWNSLEMKKTIESVPDDILLNIDEEEYIQQISNNFTIEEVAIYKDKIYITTREELIPAEWFPHGFDLIKGKRYPKQVFEFHLPYTGNQTLLTSRPSRGFIWTEKVSISHNEIKFDIINFYDKPDGINKEAENIVFEHSCFLSMQNQARNFTE